MSIPAVVAWYTIYLAATDEIVASGTAEDCVRALGLASVHSLHSLVSHAKREPQRYPKYEIFVERIKRSELP